jgi:hypothetical protein
MREVEFMRRRVDRVDFHRRHDIESRLLEPETHPAGAGE